MMHNWCGETLWIYRDPYMSFCFSISLYKGPSVFLYIHIWTYKDSFQFGSVVVSVSGYQFGQFSGNVACQKSTVHVHTCTSF